MEPVLIVGTGALACLYAARLAAAGGTVRMLGSWPEGLAALRHYGVTLVGPGGRQQSYPVQVFHQPTECPPSRYALVLVKAWQTGQAADSLATCLSNDGLALTLQNGLGNYETLAERLGIARAAQGVTTGGATLLSSGRVRPAGEGTLSLGAHARVAPLAELLCQAGFNLEVLDDVASLVWGKLAVNAAINPLTALLAMDNGGVVSRYSARQLSAGLADEVAAVAAAKGIHLPYDDPAARAAQVAEDTAANHSSMLQDVQRGAPTEIEAINGAVIREGRALAVPTPLNYAMWLLVRALVEGRVVE